MACTNAMLTVGLSLTTAQYKPFDTIFFTRILWTKNTEGSTHFQVYEEIVYK